MSTQIVGLGFFFGGGGFGCFSDSEEDLNLIASCFNCIVSSVSLVIDRFLKSFHQLVMLCI